MGGGKDGCGKRLPDGCAKVGIRTNFRAAALLVLFGLRYPRLKHGHE
jgi:hypothetical protein